MRILVLTLLAFSFFCIPATAGHQEVRKPPESEIRVIEKVLGEGDKALEKNAAAFREVMRFDDMARRAGILAEAKRAEYESTGDEGALRDAEYYEERQQRDKDRARRAYDAMAPGRDRLIGLRNQAIQLVDRSFFKDAIHENDSPQPGEPRYDHTLARVSRVHGPLRPVVRKVVDQYLDCGRLHGGFARIRCPECRAEHLLAFSCQTRNFCPSCQAKRAALLAEKLRQEILAPVDHRHWVFTIPKALRGLFERERRLLGLLSQCAFEAVKRCFGALLPEQDVVPGYVGSIQTFGSRAANFHPHIHALISEGGFTKQGEFHPLPGFDRELERAVEETFRRLLLTRLHREERLSARFLDSLLSWRHSGFSVFARQHIQNEEPARLSHMARYLVRPPVAMDRVAETGDGRVLLRIPADPGTGEEVLSLDPLEWVHRITTQIPDPRYHLVRYAGAYANRCRKRYRREGYGVRVVPAESEDPPLPIGRASWARLLRHRFEVDPLSCPRCGAEMRVVAVITEPNVVDRIRRHLDKTGREDPFEARAPPPPAA